jgi:hypothetical protein
VTESPPATASSERRRLFGLLTIENIGQIVVLVGFFASQHAYITSELRAISREQQNANERDERIQKAITEAASDTRNTMTINAQQQGQIEALQQSRDGDRKLLMDMNAKIEVLLDRSSKTPSQ